MRLLVWLFVAVACSCAAGQSDPLALFGTMRLQEALEQAEREHRFVVVYPKGPPGGQAGVYTSPVGGRLKVAGANVDPFGLMEKHTWTNRTVRGYLAWKAIPVLVDMNDHPEEWARIKAEVPANPVTGLPIEESPVVVIFKDGEVWRTVPDNRFLSPPVDGIERHRFYVKPLQILRVFDTGVEKLRSTDPVWYLQHVRSNPMPGAPVRRMLFDADDGLGVPVAEPGRTHPSNVALRLEAARAAAAGGALHEATGLYTWLWERGAAHEPALAQCRGWLLGVEMRELGRERVASRKRFESVLFELDTRELWFTNAEMYEYYVLAEIAHREDLKFEALVACLHDDTEASLMPRAERMVFELLTSQDTWVDRRVRPESDLAWLEGLCAELRVADPPGRVSHEEWVGVQRARRLVLLAEGSRLYSRAMLEGDSRVAGAIEQMARELDEMWAGPGEAPPMRVLALAARLSGCDDERLTRVLVETGCDPFAEPEPAAPDEASEVGESGRPESRE